MSVFCDVHILVNQACLGTNKLNKAVQNRSDYYARSAVIYKTYYVLSRHNTGKQLLVHTKMYKI